MMSTLRDEVPPEMRARLLTNRHGKLTSDQWKDMVTQPLVTLLLLLVPIILFLGPRMAVFTVRGVLIWLVVVLVLVFVPMLFRAQRYARAPVHFERLYAGADLARTLMFWRPQVLYNESGAEIRFKTRLAPMLRLRPNHAYLTYFLRDRGQYVLLSLAPADHPDAIHWQPSAGFQERFARRTRR